MEHYRRATYKCGDFECGCTVFPDEREPGLMMIMFDRLSPFAVEDGEIVHFGGLFDVQEGLLTFDPPIEAIDTALESEQCDTELE
jgi:hypothetical protein